MSRFVPQKAVRRGQKARLALAGPSGSGKTWTGLEAAVVLAEGAPILVCDTERGSSALYADFYDFDVIEWDPPFDPRELADVLDDMSSKYGAILVDSLSHFWEGEGGTLEIVDAAAARARGNSFAGWKEGTPAQNDMISSLLRAECHVICTMRSKVEYVLETDQRGKQVPRKVGMAPIQRWGLEYEFTVTADLDVEHTLLVDKTRCHPLAGRMYKIGHTVELAETLRDWLSTAAAPGEKCRYCTARVDAAEGDKEPMRGHLVDEHGFTRNADGTVVAPKIEGGDAATEPVEASDLTAPFEYAETKA